MLSVFILLTCCLWKKKIAQIFYTFLLLLLMIIYYALIFSIWVFLSCRELISIYIFILSFRYYHFFYL